MTARLRTTSYFGLRLFLAAAYASLSRFYISDPILLQDDDDKALVDCNKVLLKERTADKQRRNSFFRLLHMEKVVSESDATAVLCRDMYIVVRM